jgi:DNA-binding protein HU-beta
MTKTELVEKISKDADIPKVTAGKALASVLDGIQKTVKKGNSVTLVGFGTFSLVKRKARKGRNPRTGDTIKIAASKTVHFKAGKALKESL